MNKKTKNIIETLVTPILLALLFFIISSTAISYKSNTTDEASHLVRGIMLLKTGDFRLNQHHPFLFNVINAIPAVLNPSLKTEPLDSENWQLAKKDEMTIKLVEINGGTNEFSKNILYFPRLSMIFIVSLFLIAFYRIVYDTFNFKVSLIATISLVLSPSLLAHGALVTTDAPSMITIFLGSWALFKYLESKGKTQWLLIFIVLSFISLITKYTAVFVAFLWILIISYYNLIVAKKGILGTLKVFMLVLFSWLILLIGAYGFQFKTIKEVEYSNPWFNAATLDYISIIGKIGSFDFTKQLQDIYYNFKLPFPQYIKGFIDNVLKHDFFGHKTYLLGEFSDKGWWYYFPVVFSIKETVSFVVLSAFSLIYFAVRSVNLVIKKKFKYSPKVVFWIVPLFLFILSTQSSLNLGIRHLLPIFPFLAIGIGIVCVEILKKSKSGTKMLIAFLLIAILSLLNQFPHYIEYFNEIAGGPQRGFMIARDSNFDWGQNDGAAIEYIENHENVSFNKEKLQNGDKWVVRVEDLFGRPDLRSQELTKLYNDFIAGKQRPIGVINNTFWVFEVKK